ncbi:MAG: ABC transporter permease [Verrucomicrobia bacterium]|nr:ABC transporter permease [Verrucomicrobiota bacterium]
MIGTVALTYALRSLRRHRRRTVLSVVGVGIGCAIGLVATSWIYGGGDMQIRATAESGRGHLRVAPEGWLETRENSLRIADWSDALTAAETLPGVRAVAVRARANGLLAFGNRTAGVELVGAMPDDELRSNRVIRRARVDGRYLRADDRGMVVIGRRLAEKLDVGLDDDLLATLSGRDGMQQAMLTIVGLLETGSREIDGAICQVTLDELNAITGYEGPGEITILLDDARQTDHARDRLATMIPDGSEAITWREVEPEIAAGVAGDRVFTRVIIGIVVLVVLLGIASAQLTAVLERRREFGMLAALGMKGRQIANLLIIEAFVIGFGGAAVALLVGGPVAYWLSAWGVDIRAMMGDDLSMGGVLIDPVMHGDFGLWIVWYALGVSLVATLGATAYPAWRAARTEPAQAMREF